MISSTSFIPTWQLTANSLVQQSIGIYSFIHVSRSLDHHSRTFKINLIDSAPPEISRPGADSGGGGVVTPPPPPPPPCSWPPILFFNKLFNYSKKNNNKNRSEYSMDAMYLNLRFINPRPPVGAGGKDARCTRPSLTPPPPPPPPPAKNPGSAPADHCHI